MIGPGASAVDVWRLEAARRAVAGGRLDTSPPPSLWQELRTTDDASRFLGAAPPGPGEDLRLTVMFCDLVGSTALSGRQGNELYRALIGRYKALCREIIEDSYGGHILSIKGDGLLAVFGYPIAHDDGARRAVSAGLEIVDAMRELSRAAEHDVGESMSARVAMNRGQVYIDTVEDEAYGWTANVASRVTRAGGRRDRPHLASGARPRRRGLRARTTARGQGEGRRRADRHMEGFERAGAACSLSCAQDVVGRAARRVRAARSGLEGRTAQHPPHR